MGDAEVLFSSHRDGVFRYLCRVVGRHQAGELTQEVFLRVARGPLPDADAARCHAWVFSIARNLALNHVRDERRRGPRVDLEDAGSAGTQELAVALREALQRLPDIDRQVFLLRETAGLSYGEIASTCDLSAGAVRSRLHRTRQQLRAMLSPSLTRTGVMVGVKLYDRLDPD